jgi:hypothetical protein
MLLNIVRNKIPLRYPLLDHLLSILHSSQLNWAGERANEFTWNFEFMIYRTPFRA